MIAIDQLFNTLTSDGWADETISSHAYRMQHQSKPWSVARRLIDAIFFFQPNHCEISYASELMRLQEPPQLRRNTST